MVVSMELWNSPELAQKLVGEYVYKSYNPKRVGKIQEILPPGDTTDVRGNVLRWNRKLLRVRITWDNNTESIDNINCINIFNDLIQDHETKLQNHKERLKKAMEILE